MGGQVYARSRSRRNYEAFCLLLLCTIGIACSMFGAM
jgi:hypothetical protein